VAVEALHRFTGEEYRRLVEAGGFDARCELIEGLIVEMSPKSRAHERAIRLLARRLFERVDSRRFEILVAAPLSIGDSEPEPDLAVVSVDVPQIAHPVTATLVVEVASSSQRRDLVDKPRVYARAAVPTYVVVDLDRSLAVVHGEPRGDRYATVRELGPDAALPLDVVGAEPILLRAVLEHARR
jgi:Uma2 family endonuclease